MNRRKFVALTAAGITSSFVGRFPTAAAGGEGTSLQIKAVAFDAFVIF
jgi:hypothetical protein